MLDQPTNEEDRITLLELKVDELERLLSNRQTAQQTLDAAFLVRLDNAIDDIQRSSKTQLRMFETQLAGNKRLERIEQSIAGLVEVAQNHKQSIEQVAATQAQILELLLGNQRRDD